MVTVVESSIVTDGTEQDVFTFAITEFHGATLFLDNMTATETVVIKEYEKPDSGSGFILGPQVTLTGVQADKLRRFPIQPHSAGWKVTVQLTAGSNITIKHKRFNG